MDVGFMGWVAWISLAVTVSAGFCGLLMCGKTLRQGTRLNLRKEAATLTLKLANDSCLSGAQRAAVIATLYASELHRDPCRTPVARSRGLTEVQAWKMTTT